MKKKIAEWYPIFVALAGVSAQPGLLASATLPAVPRLRLTRLQRELLPHVQKYETERNEVFKALGTASEDGTRYDFSDEARAKVEAEIKPLLDLEVDVPFTPIPDAMMAGAVLNGDLSSLIDLFAEN